jgi:hypothetical protein
MIVVDVDSLRDVLELSVLGFPRGSPGRFSLADCNRVLSMETGCALSIVASYPPVPCLTALAGGPEKPGGYRTILLGNQEVL